MAPADRLPGLRGAAPFTSLKRMRSMRSTMDLTPLYRASIGFDRIAPPDGAFYVYADVSALTHDSAALAADILDRAGVAVTPGVDFDPVRGAGTLRFSYARSSGDIAEGLDRLARYMAGR